MIYDVCHKCIKRQYLIVGTSKSGNGNHTEYILHGAWGESFTFRRQYMVGSTSKSGNGNHTEYILHGPWAEGIRLGDYIWLAAPVNQETVIIQNTYYTVHEQRVYV
jgi:hypothetical protein